MNKGVREEVLRLLVWELVIASSYIRFGDDWEADSC